MSSMLWRRNKRAEERRKKINFEIILHSSFLHTFLLLYPLHASVCCSPNSTQTTPRYTKNFNFASSNVSFRWPFHRPNPLEPGIRIQCPKYINFAAFFSVSHKTWNPYRLTHHTTTLRRNEREKWKKIIFLHWISIAIMTFRYIKWNANISLCIVRVKVSNVELLTIKLAQLSRRTSDDQRNTFQYIFRCQCSFWDSDAYPRVSSRVYPCKNCWILREMEWSLLL